MKLPVLAVACGLLLGVAVSSAYAQERETAGSKAAKPAADKGAAGKSKAVRPTSNPPAAKPATTKPPAPVPATYTVVKRDNLYRIAGKVRHPGVTLPQMVLGLYRANPDAFREGRIYDLIEGRVLNVPTKEAVEAVEAKQAAREVQALTAKPPAPAPPPAPEVREPPPPKPRPEPLPPKPAARVPAPALTPERAAERFQQGVIAERAGDLNAALKAYLEAGESGHGAAQKKLGDFYNSGNAVVRRDYETALKWYQKARAQGIEIPKPLTYPASPPKTN